MEQLGEAKASLARLQGRAVVIPNQGLLVNTISLQEAKLSSAIENIFTTDDELYKAYSDTLVEATGASKEVLRYREALWMGHEMIQQQQRFDVAYFVRVFQEIKETKEGLRPPHVQTVIKQAGSGYQAGKTVYTPPRGMGVLESKLENLAGFLNSLESSIDPLLKMAIAHFQFEAIHPFRDGNGRTGRIMNIHYLTSQGLLDVPILFLSRYILDHKEDYYSFLAGVSQRGDWQGWILYMLKAIEVTSNITYDKINDIVSAKDSILDFVRKDSRKFRNPDAIIEAIFTQPFTKVKHLVEGKLYSENTARDYLNRLCELQVLERKDIEGHHYYQNLELHRILSE